jgi:hypothetical protein
MRMGKKFGRHPQNPNADGRPTYSGVQPGSPRELQPSYCIMYVIYSAAHIAVHPIVKCLDNSTVP